MQIQILGTRGEIKPSAPYHSHHSGLLIDNKLLFDIGEKTFLQYKPTHIFITHLHPDHAFFVRKKYADSFTFSMPVFAPEKYKNHPEIKISKEKMNINSYSITSIPTHHSKKVQSLSYLIEHDKNRILYTGDLIWINKEYHNLLTNLDLVITEASFIQKNGMVRRDKETGQIYGHAGIPQLIKLFKKFSSSILLTHFGEWFYENIPKARKTLKTLGKKHNINIIVGYDGLQLNITDLH